MKSLNKIVLVTALTIILLSCNVTFNSELRGYIDNIEARSPLEFELSESVIIDDVTSINMGFYNEDYNSDYTITNNENIDIDLAAFSGVNGDFIIEAFDAFTLKKGESFTCNITFNFSDTNFGKRVNQNIIFSDLDGRMFTFNLWATSKSQPLAIYSSEGLELENLDLGAWADDRTHTILLKNEGLTDLKINNISVPENINSNSENSFSLAINEEREILLTYVNSPASVVAQNIIFYSNETRDSEYDFPLYAGGTLPVSILTSDLSVVTGNIDFGTYTSGEDPISLTLFLDNTSIFDMDLEVLESTSDMFIHNLVATKLNVDQNYEFVISFKPSGDVGVKTSTLKLRDTVSDRTLEIILEGNYSSI